MPIRTGLFLCTCPTTLPIHLFHAKKSDYDALSAIDDHTERVYGAMVVALDRGIGR